MLHSSRRVCHVPCCGLCRLTFPSLSVWAVRFPAITTGRGSVILHPTRIIICQKSSATGLDSATLCVRDQQRQEHQTCEQRDPTCTTHLRSDCVFLPLAKRFGEGPSAPKPRAHSAPRTATCIPSSFFFSHSMSTTQQVSEDCELHNKLLLCVVPKTSMRNLFWPAKKCKGGLLSPISHRGEVPVVAQV